MNFNSIDEAVNYIKDICANGLDDMADKMKKIMQEEIEEQIYNDHKPEYYTRTNQLKNTPETTIGKDTVDVELMDNGDWTSFKKKHFFPMFAWEVPDKPNRNSSYVYRSKTQNGGYYPKTNIVEESYNKCNQEIPIKFKEYLIGKGLDVN